MPKKHPIPKAPDFNYKAHELAHDGIDPFVGVKVHFSEVRDDGSGTSAQWTNFATPSNQGKWLLVPFQYNASSGWGDYDPYGFFKLNTDITTKLFQGAGGHVKADGDPKPNALVVPEGLGGIYKATLQISYFDWTYTGAPDPIEIWRFRVAAYKKSNLEGYLTVFSPWLEEEFDIDSTWGISDISRVVSGTIPWELEPGDMITAEIQIMTQGTYDAVASGTLALELISRPFQGLLPLAQGPQGPEGPQGPQGPQGPPGPGVPAGGTTGQSLRKASNADYDTAWQNVAHSDLTGVSADQHHAQAHSDADHTGPNKVAVQDEGTLVGTRKTLNFTGAGVTATDDAANDRVVINIPGGGGGGSISVEEDDVAKVSSATVLDMRHGLDVTESPAGEANIDVDESELDHNLLANRSSAGAHPHSALSGVGADDHHTKLHNVTDTAHHGFPGGTTTFLRADGTWATPSGGGGGGKASYIWMSRPRVETGIGRKFFADRNGTIDLIYAWATDQAPSSTLTVDVLKNGASIFTTNPKPTVASGQFLGADATPNTTSFVKGDKFEVEIESTGGAQGRIGVLIRFNY